MQGNKKHADGQSDSSSIGSLLDDTDREVCSLTDRAFKSLCVAELQTSYTDADPVAGPPNVYHQLSSKFFHGPWDYSLRRNINFHKQLSKKEHTTFLLSKVSTNSKTHEDKKYSIVNPSIRRKLDLPLSDLHNCTHISKVSSLIKTFDKVDNQVSLLLARQPGSRSLTECPLICGDNMAFWSGKRILNIPRGIPELPNLGPSQGNPSDKHKGYSKIDLVYQSPPASHPSQANISNTPKVSISNKMVKTRSGKVKEVARKSSFLHSENSAFESWNAHHKKIIDLGETMSTEGSLSCFKETPFFTRPCVSEPKPIGAFMPEETFSDDSLPKSLTKASLSSVPLAEVYFPSPANATRTVAPQLLAQGLAPVHENPSPTSPTCSMLFPPRMSPSIPVSKAPLRQSPFPQISLLPEAAFCCTDTRGMLMPPVTERAGKTTEPEFALGVGNGGPPPWRKQKSALPRMKLADIRAAEVLEIKDSPYGKSPGVESRVILPDPSFSISALLTPVPPLKPKNEGPPGNRLLVVTPFMLEAGATKEPEEKAFYSQNDYKSKAPRLLFNLKDIRKRVKSTYSPSPLLRALEDKNRMKATGMATSVLGDSNKKTLGGTDKVNIFEQMDYIQEKDNFTSLNENFISDDVLLSLSKSRAGILKYQNKNHLQQSNPVYMEDVEMVSVHEQSKAQTAPSPKPRMTDVAAVQQEVVQEHQHRKVTLGQDADGASRNLFYPAEENAGKQHGTQAFSSSASAGNDLQDKRSPCSSEQSFVATVDQPCPETTCSLMQLFQKACLQESQRRRNDMGGREEQSDKEKAKKKDLRGHLLSNYDSAMDETDKEKNEKEDVPQEEKEKDGWKSIDHEAESKPGELLTPTLSSVLRPTLFMIKDNTFKSPPVTKAIKHPLLRSLSCEEATPVAQENPRNAPEDGWGSLQGNSGGSQVADKSSLPTNDSFSEGLDCLSVLPEKELKGPEKLAISKEKIRIRKWRSSSAIQPNLHFESETGQSEEMSPIRERIYYMKNRALATQSGPCTKRIISQERKSPVVAENHACSPASSDAFGYTSPPLSNSAGSALHSPRSDSVEPSASKGPLSDTTAKVRISQTEKAANHPLHKATGSLEKPSTTPTLDPEQMGQLPGDAERLQLVSQMGRTTAKPPTVPPKTEKALRRAKKLASRRKKMEAQQKKLQDETLAQNEDASSLTPVQSLRSLGCPDSPLTAPKCDLIKHQPLLSLSPTPSLPAIQRKLLQDPDSGEYFIVDLPLQLKTLYDPESGRYIQVSVPPSKRNVSQTPSSEMSFSPCAWGPSTLPPRVASVPALPSSAQLLEMFTKASSGSVSDEQPGAASPGPLDGRPCPDSAQLDICSQNVDGSPSNFEKDMSTSATPQNVPMGSAEEFGVEGVV